MKIICAMSGGVDSSVAALLLKNEGHEVIGVTMKLWECFKAPIKRTCCSAADTVDARNICEQIGIKHHVIDMRDAFRKHVVDYFAREYAIGRTPNPCIKCNEILKFDLLRKETLKLFGTDLLATGHYARIDSSHGTIKLLKGLDPNKDQSYFLFTLSKEELEKTFFPLGGLKKDEVRKIAVDAGLKTAEKKESQEICFVPDDDYSGFISDYYPDIARRPGNFVNKHGEILGRHEGSHAYTVGQRRGIGFGLGKRQYVIKIDPAKNEVVLGNDEDLFEKEMIVTECKNIKDPFNAQVKIRYRHPGVFASIIPVDKTSVRVLFNEPQRAITPGQAAVFYDGDVVLGGGWIK